MITFAVLTPVDTSTGIARIGKPHVITKREVILSASRAETIQQANDGKRREDITKDMILELKSAGMSLEQIALELECSRGVIYNRLAERR